MTAEIAILNKSAVALATDSAVTISAGTESFKMFDTGDKLFELCDLNPIGIMINNSMDFVGVPLPSVVRRFRTSCPKYDRVAQAAEEFLAFLNDDGRSAPSSQLERYEISVSKNVADILIERTKDQFQQGFAQWMNSKADVSMIDHDIDQYQAEVWSQQISVLSRRVSGQKNAEFVGLGEVPLLSPDIANRLSERLLGFGVPEQYCSRIVCEVLYPILIGDISLGLHTGIVIAGFGDQDLFPTLISIRVEGMVFGSLKIVRDEMVDIDRDGRRAAVLPFAQREMVDRFIFGFDDHVQKAIASFCSKNLDQFRTSVRTMLDFVNEAEEQSFDQAWAGTQDQFLRSLRDQAFETVRLQTQSSMEELVEFMPKPELARMAEALIEVTSLKRRISHGMETVAGPIDVAVISQSEGFVWVKRKHYFKAELNPRHAARVRDAGERRYREILNGGQSDA
ncbi:hypothetical protein IGS74_18075 [Aureimonas sp. OT7]|uniref:hypothetical protein n=1 Tax=Aureimonas sp. OT7 TaxID=2816454 RepID=UPI001784D874|nr:hypothetical protein [Aureimonas sp. OT7]QOG06410.1 hypothetical protein IGS74_18075 [Aureimonas sp. OT7]